MSHHKHNSNKSREPRLAGVAPAHLLKEDFVALDARATLRCSYDVEQLVLMQSVEGHAHAGHGLFYGKTYPNTTMDDVARALRLSPEAVKADRQMLIDEIVDFVQRVAAGQKACVACNSEGEPLLRCGILRQVDVDPIGVLRGLYTGGLRDDPEIRKLANDRYGIQMGYGECRLVDQLVLDSLGLNGYDLSQMAHEHEMDAFEQAGLFADSQGPHTAYMYVRLKVGPGASDDAAIVMAGRLLGLSGAIGCFLADAVDTLEKYVPEYADQDSRISLMIEQSVPDLGLSRDDAVDLAYLCAIPEDMKGRLPDSSLRKLLEVERKHDQSTIESHLAYVAGKPFATAVLDHGECTNREFYDYIEDRFASFERKR